MGVFKDEFVANIQTANRTSYGQWKQSNPGEAAKWEQFRDDVIAGKTPVPPTLATKYGRALVAAGKLEMSVTDIGSDLPAGTVLFDGDVEAGTVIPPWDIIQQWAAGRATTQTTLGGISARVGSRFLRLEVRQGDTIYGAGTDACQVIRRDDQAGHFQVLGDDTYQGFSFYFKTGEFLPCVSNRAFNNMYEWHGNTSSVYAPVSIILDNNFTPAKWRATLHTVPDYPNFHPQYFDMQNIVYDQWVDFVFHIKWSQGSDGKYTGWQKLSSASWGTNPTPVFDYTGQTWYIGSPMSAVKPQIGYYRESNAANQNIVFVNVDGYKIGTTFVSVAP